MAPYQNKNSLPNLTTLPGRLSVCVEKAGGKRSLAAKAICSEAQLFRYLNGESDMPLERLLRIANSVDIDPAWLATGLESKPTTKQKPEFRPALMQFTSRVLDEMLLEYQRPMAPRLKSQLLTLIYEALRHEEVVMGKEDYPNKFRMLEILTFFEPFKTEELLQTYHEVMGQLEYGQIDPDQHQLLSVFCNLVSKGWEHYYNSYVGEVYFERIGYDLLDEAQAELHTWVSMALQATGKPDVRWLDLGCGNGRHLAFLRKFYPKMQLKGVEPSVQGVELCNKLEQQGKLPEGAVVKGDAQQIPLADESMDVVFARHCLQFVPYLPGSGLGMEKVLSELYRVLSTGGMLYLRSPSHIGSYRRYACFWQVFDVNQLREVVEKAGFTVVSCHDDGRASDNAGGKLADCSSYVDTAFTLVLRKK